MSEYKYIYVRSAHTNDKKVKFRLAQNEELPYDGLKEECFEFFGYKGYLVAFYENNYKICLTEDEYFSVEPYLYNYQNLYYVRDDCLKIIS